MFGLYVRRDGGTSWVSGIPPKREPAATADDGGMKPITFSLQFRGITTAGAPGVLITRATAPSCSLVTEMDADGVHGHFEPAPGDEAVLESRILLAEDGRFHVTGAITFGHRHRLRFRSLDLGRLSLSPDLHLRHGSAISEIEEGHGQFVEARGRITSNFFLSDTGEFTDNQLGLLFVAAPSADDTTDDPRASAAPAGGAPGPT